MTSRPEPRDGGAGSTGRRAARAGFTLLELLVVLAVLGLSLALLAASRPGNPRLEDRAALEALAGGLRRARAEAIAADRPTGSAIDLAAKRWRIEGARSETAERRLPARLAVSLTTAAGETRGGVLAWIRFLPDGSSTGGRIALDDGNWHGALAVNWLTGLVSQTS